MFFFGDMSMLASVGAFQINTENVKTAVWCAVVGVLIAFVTIFFNKTVSGSLVRALLGAGAVGMENAKTLAEAGVENADAAVRSYKKSAMIRRLVGTDREEIDDRTRFFIYEEEEKRAEQQYGMHGNEIFILILGAVFFIAVGVFVTVLL